MTIEYLPVSITIWKQIINTTTQSVMPYGFVHVDDPYSHKGGKSTGLELGFDSANLGINHFCHTVNWTNFLTTRIMLVIKSLDL